MSTSQEAPSLIQYACERCKTRFVLPPSSPKLSIFGKMHAFAIGVRRVFGNHEGLGAGYEAARRDLLSRMDDNAYQSFVQSFRFCHECRQFVCNECWSTSRRSCLSCVAKAMTGTARPRPPFAPTGPEIPRPIAAAATPRKGRLRRDVVLVAVAVGIVLLSFEGGYLLWTATGGVSNATPVTLYTAGPTGTPFVAPTATPAADESGSASPSADASASASGSASAGATARATVRVTPKASGSATPTPTSAPTPTPAPTTPSNPAITCNLDPGPITITAGQVLDCSWDNAWSGYDNFAWSPWGGPLYDTSTWSGGYIIELTVTVDGIPYDSNQITVTVI